MENEYWQAVARAWQDIALARAKLLTAYRTGSPRTPATALDQIDRAQKLLVQHGINPHDGKPITENYNDGIV